MDTFIALNKKNRVIQNIICNIELFESFEYVFLFGSIIDENRTSNDIDLLLIYKDFSNRLLNDLDKIRTTFNQLYGFSFDCTVISEHEEVETSFIIRLNSNYLRLK